MAAKVGSHQPFGAPSPSHPDLSTLSTTSSPTHHTIFQCARTTNSLSSHHIHLTNTTMAHQSSPPSTSTNPLDLNSVFSHKMFETSILLQTSDEEGSTTQIEPLPNLDYHLLYTLIQLARYVISCHIICSYTWSPECPCVHRQMFPNEADALTTKGPTSPNATSNASTT